MLKQAPFHSPDPKRAETRYFPSFVLGSQESSTYPTSEKSCLGSSGWAGGKPLRLRFVKDPPPHRLVGVRKLDARYSLYHERVSGHDRSLIPQV